MVTVKPSELSANVLTGIEWLKDFCIALLRNVHAALATS